MASDLDPADLPSRADLARELLLYKMKEYSQDLFCAGWLAGLEIELWETADRMAPAGRESFAVDTGKECRRLAEIADGWWVWPDTVGREGNGVIFLTLDEWKQCYAQRKPGSCD